MNGKRKRVRGVVCGVRFVQEGKRHLQRQLAYGNTITETHQALMLELVYLPK